jgi:hypothetical protein
MKQKFSLAIVAIIAGFGIVGCADAVEKKPVGPVSDVSQIPWNSPVAGQGQGQFGMLPQNEYRR